jgi:hypothetical protein
VRTGADCTLFEPRPQFERREDRRRVVSSGNGFREALVVMAAMSTWSVRLLRRSGRELAQWSLGDRAASDLERLWAQLPLGATAPALTPTQRYGGLLVSHGGVEFLVYANHVERRDDASSEHRHDPTRSVEALILGSAPNGCLPPES